MEFINVGILGEISYGKTTLVSVLINQIAGSIKMKRSTLNYTKFIESEEINLGNGIENTGLNTDNSNTQTGLKCNIVKIPFLKNFGMERKYKYSIIDSVGFNDIDIEKENIQYFEKEILPQIDILLVLLDVTKALSTKSEQNYLNKIKSYEQYKIFVINKVDDINDEELNDNVKIMTTYLEDNKFSKKSDILICSSKNLYDTVFKTKYYSSLQLLYYDEQNICKTFGYYDIVNKINKFVVKNINGIFNKKLNNMVENCHSLTEFYNLYLKFYEIFNSVDPIINYLKKIRLHLSMFDDCIKNWIHTLDDYSISFIIKNYCDLINKNLDDNGEDNVGDKNDDDNDEDDDENDENDDDDNDEEVVKINNENRYDEISMNSIYNIFGNNPNVITSLIIHLDYKTHKNLIYNLIKNNNYLVNDLQIKGKFNAIIKNKIRNISSNLKESEYDKIFIDYLMIKYMSRNMKLSNMFPNLNIVNYLNFDNKYLNNFILNLKNNIESYFVHRHLYKICSLFLESDKVNNYQTIKNNYINEYLKQDFVIFPCNLDKTPMIKNWNKLNQHKSRKLYLDDSEINFEYFNFNPKYYKCNIGLLCGVQSGVVVIDVDLKDNGVEYWNNLLGQNMNGDIDTLKVISGSGGFHYYFKWDTRMKKWFSKNRIFTDIKQKVGIDLRADNGYIIVPPSIHHDTQNLYKFTLDDGMSNLRQKIKEMPEWLFVKINFYLESLNEKKQISTLNIKDSLNTVEMALVAVIKNPNNIKYISDNLKTSEICEIAVRKRGYLIEYVPDNLITKEICEIAVSQDSDSFEYIPDNLKTEKICRIAVSNNGRMLHYVPECLKTGEICKIAVSNNGYALKYVPNNLRNEEICKISVSDTKNLFFSSLEYVPNNLKTFEICKIAVSNNKRALEFVPDNLKTKEICDLAKR